jgi:hypothetical protein
MPQVRGRERFGRGHDTVVRDEVPHLRGEKLAAERRQELSPLVSGRIADPVVDKGDRTTTAGETGQAREREPKR